MCCMAPWVWLLAGALLAAAAVLSSVRAWRQFESRKPDILSGEEQDDPPVFPEQRAG
jgi:hypothetical protein